LPVRGGSSLNVYHYETAGGKDVIESYIDKLSKNETIDGYSVLKAFEEDRIDEVVTKKWRHIFIKTIDYSMS
jgi:hypothetical protein